MHIITSSLACMYVCAGKNPKITIKQLGEQDDDGDEQNKENSILHHTSRVGLNDKIATGKTMTQSQVEKQSWHPQTGTFQQRFR